MRKALIVGVDYYEDPAIPDLSGCVNDAHAVKNVLERHADGTLNFATPKLLTGTGPGKAVRRADLRHAVHQLFEGDSEIALFYFAGHGHIEQTGGYLCASDIRSGDEGLPLADIMKLAADSRAKNKVIILDSCHSGVAGNRSVGRGTAEIEEGMTVLTASEEDRYAMEVPGGGSGVFTGLLVDALSGAAASLLGDITPGSVYAHIDRSLGSWEQRPVFKTNVKSFVSLRKVVPPIELATLLKLPEIFPRADHVFSLDPSYEPERFTEHLNDPSIPPPDPEKVAVFAVLQRYVKVNLVRPVGAPHMWHAAMHSKACELTALGQHYRNLVEKGLL